MSDTAGVRFSETMTGGVALGESDYQTGEDKAKQSEDILVLNAQVTIDDLEQFINDPQHFGRLDGSIDYPPFGTNLPGQNGRFNLFSPGNDPQTKFMIYELGFQHDGQDYYLAGRKEVRDDPGFDLWNDTTTLYTQLYKGKDTSGEVVGAGILSLGINDFVRLLSTLEVLHADGSFDKLETLARFGRFFAGELWDTYAGMAQ